jgi:hypothetical protein
MRRSGWEAPTYPSFDFRQSAEKSLVLSMKLASARTLRARGSGTGPGRWVDLASLKASRPRMYALGRAGRPRSRHFTAKRLSKTKLALHTCSYPTEALPDSKHLISRPFDGIESQLLRDAFRSLFSWTLSGCQSSAPILPQAPPASLPSA